MLTCTILRANSADDKLIIFFTFFPENRFWDFMQTVSNLNEMSKPISWKNKKIFQYVLCWKLSLVLRVKVRQVFTAVCYKRKLGGQVNENDSTGGLGKKHKYQLTLKVPNKIAAFWLFFFFFFFFSEKINLDFLCELSARLYLLWKITKKKKKKSKCHLQHFKKLSAAITNATLRINSGRSPATQNNWEW